MRPICACCKELTDEEDLGYCDACGTSNLCPVCIHPNGHDCEAAAEEEE